MSYSRPTMYRIESRRNGLAPDWYQAGDSSMYSGYVCMEDDADEVKVCTTSGRPFGVIGSTSYHDLNTVWAAGDSVPVWQIGCGIHIWVVHDGAAAGSIAKADAIIRSTTTAGTVVEKTAYVSKDTTYSAAEFAEDTDTPFNMVGMAVRTITVTSGTAAVIEVKLVRG